MPELSKITYSTAQMATQNASANVHESNIEAE